MRAIDTPPLPELTWPFSSEHSRRSLVSECLLIHVIYVDLYMILTVTSTNNEHTQIPHSFSNAYAHPSTHPPIHLQSHTLLDLTSYRQILTICLPVATMASMTRAVTSRQSPVATHRASSSPTLGDHSKDPNPDPNLLQQYQHR